MKLALHYLETSFIESFRVLEVSDGGNRLYVKMEDEELRPAKFCSTTIEGNSIWYNLSSNQKASVQAMNFQFFEEKVNKPAAIVLARNLLHKN